MKIEYRVETFKSAEEFQEHLNNLADGWELHSFAPGVVQWAVAVLWKPLPPLMVTHVPAWSLEAPKPFVSGKS